MALINDILKLLDKFIKLHIKNQVKSGATIIKIFDSWAGLVKKDFDNPRINDLLRIFLSELISLLIKTPKLIT